MCLVRYRRFRRRPEESGTDVTRAAASSGNAASTRKHAERWSVEDDA